MSRPTTITDDQILDAARAVFLEEGFGATTAKISRRAGVSEGTIFKRFQTKEALFAAALEIEYPPAWHKLTQDLVGAGDVQENLAHILLSLFSFHLDSVPRMIGRLAHPLSHSGQPEKPPLDSLPVLDMEMLTRYCEGEMSRGRIRRCDSRQLSSLLFGSLIHQAIHATVMQQELSLDRRREIVHGIIAVLWSGIAPSA